MSDFAPGIFVQHPTQPDWGIGQVQSAVGHRVTVNFEHRGKVLIDVNRIALVVVDPDASDHRGRPTA